jgi:fructose-1,6-bisphosphatase/sedoheptulose 1,7-bisphosphatase-like protein
MRTKASICAVSRRRFVKISLLMRTNLSTLRRPVHARGIRRPRSNRIGAGGGAIHAITNPAVAAQMGNQITNPMVDVMVGVQAAAEAVINTNFRPVTEFGEALISHSLDQ